MEHLLILRIIIKVIFWSRKSCQDYKNRSKKRRISSVLAAPGSKKYLDYLELLYNKIKIIINLGNFWWVKLFRWIIIGCFWYTDGAQSSNACCSPVPNLAASVNRTTNQSRTRQKYRNITRMLLLFYAIKIETIVA
jgi:hypothetical protein